MKYSDKQIKKYLDGIFDGTINQYNLPEDLYYAISEYLLKGLYMGIGETLETITESSRPLLVSLSENIYMFGAAKTYQQTIAISELLISEEGMPSRSEFNKLGREMFDTWNNSWGATEYNTALGQAQMVSQWKEIEATKDVLPNLRYSAVVDQNTSEICNELDGLVASVDDEVWDRFSPLNHFNCRCLLLQEDESVTTSTDIDKRIDFVSDIQNPTFAHNPYKTGAIFPKEHPYFDVIQSDKEYAKQNFNLPIPKL